MRSPLRWMDDPVDVDDRWTLYAMMFGFAAFASWRGYDPLLLGGFAVALFIIDLIREARA